MTQNRVLAGRRIVSGAAVALLVLAGVWGMAPAGATTAPAGVSPLDADQAYVASAYQDFLGRIPHGVEWDAIENDLSTPASRGQFVGSLANSPEWVTTTVQILYLNTLGREGDEGGVAYWVRMIRTKRLSVATVAASMYSSQEYFDGFGNGVVHTWVLDLYTKVLLRDGADDPKGVAYWTNMTGKVGRTNVAYALYQSDESRHTRVKGLYETLLGRSPVGDKAGWDYWAKVITNKGDLALASALASSDEYYNRAVVRFANAGPGTWALSALGGDDSLLGNIVLGPHEVGNGSVVCTLPCQPPTRLAGLAGYSEVHAVGATSSGVIVGSATDSDGNHAGLVWAGAAASPTLLALPQGATDVLVSAVGASGVVVGSAVDGSGVEVPYFWSSPDAQPTALAAPIGALGSWATGVSPTGVIYGAAINGDFNPGNLSFSGLVWTTTSAAPTIIVAPGGDGQVQISAMSASGVIVGFGETAAGVDEGLVWDSPTAAPSLLTRPTGSGLAVPIAISASGQIIGVSVAATDTSFEHPAPIAWASKTATPTPMAVPSGYTGGAAIGFLSTGEIIGNGSDSLGDNHVLVWTSTSATPTVLPDVS